MIENKKDITRLGTTIYFGGIYERSECYGIEQDVNFLYLDMTN